MGEEGGWGRRSSDGGRAGYTCGNRGVGGIVSESGLHGVSRYGGCGGSVSGTCIRGVSALGSGVS